MSALFSFATLALLGFSGASSAAEAPTFDFVSTLGAEGHTIEHIAHRTPPSRRRPSPLVSRPDS